MRTSNAKVLFLCLRGKLGLVTVEFIFSHVKGLNGSWARCLSKP